MSSAPAARPRLDSIDVLRGIVMVVMALDHVRDYFSGAPFDPTDLAQTTPAYFLTRFATHFCAPVFVFLAGTGAYLGGTRGKSTKELSLFLLTRGLWLVLLELTVIRVGWRFGFDVQRFGAGVIWAIGWSMVALAGLVFLPRRVVLAFGLVMIAAHNAFDGVAGFESPFLESLWTILHHRGLAGIAGVTTIGVLYPLIPWIGVLAAGYGFGELFAGKPDERRRRVRRLGIACCVAFVVLRGFDAYGDPQPWSAQKNALFTVFSFVNCTKYPPSLDYLLMTLGPALVLLAWLPDEARGLARVFAVYGRVPLFYYVLHLYLIHALALLAGGDGIGDGGYGLPVVYAVWALVVIALYLPCARWGELKRTRRSVWLSYL